jgi:hypothetical protein
MSDRPPAFAELISPGFSERPAAAPNITRCNELCIGTSSRFGGPDDPALLRRARRRNDGRGLPVPDAKAKNIPEKFGNSIGRSNTLFKTYNPVDLEKVRITGAQRLQGRRKRNKT